MNNSIRPDLEGASQLRQPTQPFTITLTCPDSIDLTSVDDWLESTLGIVIEPYRATIPEVRPSSNNQVAGFLWRCLLLIRVFLQSASIPAFDTGNIIKVDRDERDSSKWVAVIAIAKIDHIPSRCYLIAMESAIKMIKLLMRIPKTPENIKSLYDIIEKKVTQPLRRMVVAGKSTIPVLRTAYRLDIPFLHCGAGVYQLGWGCKSRQMDRSTTGSDTAIGSKLAQNKVWSANLVRMAGLPAPVHGVVTTAEEAARVAHQLGWPVVVKPTDCDRGEGVAVGLMDDQQLLTAFETAKGLSKAKQVIIEREVAGVCHRLFIAEGRLLYAFKRLPKSVKGDGQGTVAELIHDANKAEESKPPWLRAEPFPNDALAVEAIAAAGYTLESVPGECTWVPLRNIETTRWGGHFVDVTQYIHSDNLDIAIRAAELFGLNVAGVDIMTSDIQKPWHENDAIINEVNFSPLFGANEMSRSYIPTFFSRFMDGDGRVPVEVVMGGDAAMDLAKARQKDLINCGTKCFLSSHQMTLTHSDTEMPFPFQSLFKRCRALLMNRQVEAIVLLIQTDELLHLGLPVDRINQILTAAGELTSWKNPGDKLPESVSDSMLALLKETANRKGLSAKG